MAVPPIEPMDLYWKIKHQRKDIVAPVDTMGCALAPEGLSPEDRKFHILIALLLSSQTRDEITSKAMKNLHKLLDGLTPQKIVKAPPKALHKAIEKVGYHNKKVIFLQKIGLELSNKNMPERLEEVLRLPGVGQKMAHLYMQHACDINTGIGVDTHVHRISNRIGLASTKTPENTRRILEKEVPHEEWKDINSVLVGFGQCVCLPVHPRCDMCCISTECPFFNSN